MHHRAKGREAALSQESPQCIYFQPQIIALSTGEVCSMSPGWAGFSLQMSLGKKRERKKKAVGFSNLFVLKRIRITKEKKKKKEQKVRYFLLHEWKCSASKPSKIHFSLSFQIKK